jgi:hypothetical protein
MSTKLIGGPLDGETTDVEPNEDGLIVVDVDDETEHHHYTAEGVYVGQAGPIMPMWQAP